VVLGIQISLVTRPEPALSEGMPIGYWIVAVALHDGPATHNDLTEYPCWQQGTHRIHNGHLYAHRHTHRSGFPLPLRWWMTSYHRGFRQAVGLNDRHIKHSF